MKLFDLHCDTIGECCNKQLELYDNGLHISLKRADFLEKWVQVFAIWMPDELRGSSAAEYFDRVFDYYQNQITQNSAVISEYGSDKCFSAMLAVEGGSVLCGEISRVALLAERNVRLLTLTWNGENELGYGSVSGIGEGLKPFGRQVVKEAERKGIIVDVSHLNRRGFFDVAELSEKPFVATHSNCSAVCSHPRNLDDEQIGIIVNRCGLIGLNLYESFLGDDGGLDAVYAHVSHFLDLGAADCLAMGTDFDGCTVSPVFNGIEKLGVICEYFLQHGIEQNIIDKIFFENAQAFFSKVN